MWNNRVFGGLNNHQENAYPIDGFLPSKVTPLSRSPGVRIQMRRLNNHKKLIIQSAEPTDNRVITFPDATITVNDAAHLSGTALPNTIINSDLQTLGVQTEPLNMGTFEINNCASIVCIDNAEPIASKAKSGHLFSMFGPGSLTASRSATFPDRTIVVNNASDLDGATLNSGVTLSSLTTLGPQAENLDMNNNSVNAVKDVNINSTNTTILTKTNGAYTSTLVTPTLTANRTVTMPNATCTLNDAGGLTGNMLNNGVTLSSLTTLGPQAESLDMNSNSIINASLLSCVNNANPILIKYKGSYNYNLDCVTPTANRVITMPDASITINAAGQLSGTTLAANVTLSSLTTLGDQTEDLNMGGNDITNCASVTTNEVTSSGNLEINAATLLYMKKGIRYDTRVINTLENYSAVTDNIITIDQTAHNNYSNYHLPSAVTYPGRTLTFIKKGTNPSNHQFMVVGTVDGVANFTMDMNEEVKTLLSDGVEWKLIYQKNAMNGMNHVTKMTTGEFYPLPKHQTLLHDLVVRNNYINVNLPNPTTLAGKRYTIKRSTANPGPNQTTYIKPGAYTIDGVAGDYNMAGNFEVIELCSDGSNWVKLN